MRHEGTQDSNGEQYVNKQEELVFDIEENAEAELLGQLDERLKELNPKLRGLNTKARELIGTIKSIDDFYDKDGSSTGYMLSLPVGILAFLSGGSALAAIGGIGGFMLTVNAIARIVQKYDKKKYEEICDDIENIQQLAERANELQIKKLVRDGATWQSVMDENGSVGTKLVLTETQGKQAASINKGVEKGFTEEATEQVYAV